MFRNRMPPPEVTPAEEKLLRLVAEGVTLKTQLYNRGVSLSTIRRAVAREIVGMIKTTVYIPEHMLVNQKKTWDKLSLEEADYFAAKMLGIDVVLQPVVEDILNSPVVCVHQRTGAWVCPTADWSLAEKLMHQRRIVVTLLSSIEKKASSTTHSVTHRRRCCAIVLAALARETPYEIDYTDATARHNS